MRTALLVALLWACPGFAQNIEATTAAGEKVILMPNGRWEFADPAKAQVQRGAAEKEASRERAAQGGLFGVGRKVYEGDKDYNRGTLNPAKR